MMKLYENNFGDFDSRWYFRNNGEYFVNIEKYFKNIHISYMQKYQKRHTVASCIASSDCIAYSKLSMVSTFKATQIM